MTLLGKRYAAALYALAAQHGIIDAVASDLAGIHAALLTPAARALLTSPDVRPDERSRVLQLLTKGRHAMVVNLVGVLQHRRRLEVLFDIQPAFRAMVMAQRGEVEGVAESAHPLGDAELAALTTLAGRLSGKKVQLTSIVRADLLGGVRLRVGNVLYDGSLRAALDQLQHTLTQTAV